MKIAVTDPACHEGWCDHFHCPYLDPSLDGEDLSDEYEESEREEP